jgi:hypothetical protein
VPFAMNALLNYRFFSPARAVLDDLIDSGNLGIIRSDSLRFGLQNYLQELERLDVVERRERDFVADVVEPYVANALPLNDILPIQSYDDDIVAAPVDLRAFRDMLRDDAFANVVFMRWERSIVAFGFGTRIGRTIAGLERLLTREIERR